MAYHTYTDYRGTIPKEKWNDAWAWASGTFASGSIVEAEYVPYTGASSNVDLGSNELTLTGATTGVNGSFSGNFNSASVFYVDQGEGAVGIGINPTSDTYILYVNGKAALFSHGLVTQGDINFVDNDDKLIFYEDTWITGDGTNLTLTTNGGDVDVTGNVDVTADVKCVNLTATGTITGEQLTSTDDITAAGNLLNLGDSSAGDPKINFLSDKNGYIQWMEDEERFDFNCAGTLLLTLDGDGTLADFQSNDIATSGTITIGSAVFEDDGSQLYLTGRNLEVKGTAPQLRLMETDQSDYEWVIYSNTKDLEILSTDNRDILRLFGDTGGIAVATSTHRANTQLYVYDNINLASEIYLHNANTGTSAAQIIRFDVDGNQGFIGMYPDNSTATALQDDLAIGIPSGHGGDVVFWLNSAVRARMTNAGVFTLGDDGTANYAQFAANGTLTLEGTARYSIGFEIDSSGFKEPPAQSATLVNRGIGTAYEFTDGSEEHIHAGIRLTGRWVATSGLAVILLWDSPTTSEDCDWEVRYQFRAPNEDMTSEATDGTVASFETSSSTTKGLVHSSITIPSEAFNSGDKILNLEIWRDGDDDGDTLGASAFLHRMIVKGVANKLGGAT